MPTPTINRITQSQALTPNGQVVNTYVVNFSVGPHGPFTLQIPSAEFTAEAVKRKLAEFAANLDATLA